MSRSRLVRVDGNFNKGSGLDCIPFASIPDLRGPVNIEHCIFIRPASPGVTPIWYKCLCISQSLHGSKSSQFKKIEWKWTPYDPFKLRHENDDISNDYIFENDAYDKNHEWIDIKILKVPNGFWKGIKPAEPNIKIIKFLNRNIPIPPHISWLTHENLKFIHNVCVQ